MSRDTQVSSSSVFPLSTDTSDQPRGLRGSYKLGHMMTQPAAPGPLPRLWLG